MTPPATPHNSALTVTVMDALSLDETTIWEWTAIQNAVPCLASPFLGPGFTQLVARCKGGVRVAVLQSEGRAHGFFPFEDDETGRGVAVGYGYSDYQGVIAQAGLSWTAKQVMDATGLTSLTFGHLIGDQAKIFLPSGRRGLSFIIDIPLGYDTYAAQLKIERRSQLVQANRKLRKLERDIGPVTFQVHDPVPALLTQLLTWKGAQWARSGRPGRFSQPWERALMTDLMATDEPGFGGLLSVLRAGDRIAALHLGLRSHIVWHYWIPAYNPKLSRYSPGIILLDQMLRAASGLGLRIFDLGKEDFVYKRRLMNRTEEVAEGTYW